MPSQIADHLIDRLYRKARAERWSLSLAAFAEALEASLSHAPAKAAERPERYLNSLHLEDLALACACTIGNEQAWDHFMREHRPLLYRAADALAPGGAARELADSLYGDLYGLRERDRERYSLFRYFHARSSLATWLRAVLAQRFIDRVRSDRRLDPLPDDDAAMPAADTPAPDFDRARYAALIERALALAIARLQARDRLRLGCYYAQALTLAQTGRLLGEHEATVSRKLARTRKAIRQDVERQLRETGLTEDEIAACFAGALEDSGALDLSRMLDAAQARKESMLDRSS